MTTPAAAKSLKSVRKPTAPSSGVVLEIPLGLIRNFVGQPRKHFNQARLAELATSIKKHRQITPGMVIELPPGEVYRYELVDGERRFIACKMADTKIFRAEVVTVTDSREQLLRSAIANYHREPHTALEDAETCRRLAEIYEMSWPEVAATLGKSLTWVTQSRIPLLQLDKRVQAMIEPSSSKLGELPVLMAVELTKVPATKQYQMAVKAVHDEMRLSDMRHAVRRFQNKTGYRHGTRRIRTPGDDYKSITTFYRRSTADAQLWLSMTPVALAKMFENRPEMDYRRLLKASANAAIIYGRLMKKIQDLK